jgi:hypothetical protein
MLFENRMMAVLLYIEAATMSVSHFWDFFCFFLHPGGCLAGFNPNGIDCVKQWRCQDSKHGVVGHILWIQQNKSIACSREFAT